MSKLSTVEELTSLLQASAGEVSALGKIQNGSTEFSNLVKGVETKQQAEEQVRRDEEEAERKRIAAEVEKKRQQAEEKRKADLLAKGFITISVITGGRLPKSGIDHEVMAFPSGTWAEEHEAHIPSVDPHYYWDADLLEMMILCEKLRERGLLVGLPGTGKTSATKQFAAWRKQPFARFNGKGSIDASSFLGYIQAESKITTLADGSQQVTPVTVFREGLMPVAVREGYLTVIDEVMKLSPDIQMSLQSLYEKDGFLMLDDKPGTIMDKQVQPDSKFLLYCTDNTCGTGDNLDLFAASQLQDTSTLDRFGFTYEVNYLPKVIERKMLKGINPKVKDVDIKDLVSLAGLVRKAYRDCSLPVTLSPRGLMTMTGTLEMGLDFHATIQIVFGNKLGEDSHVAKLRELIGTVRRPVNGI